MRKLLVGAAALWMALGGAMPAVAGEGDDPRADYVENYGTVVPLQLPGGAPAVVRAVYLNVGGAVQAADPGAGVRRQSQNRLDWSELPLVGRLAQDRYNQADFAPARAVGEAYFAAGTVWIDLSDDAAGRTYPQVVFLNQDYAYRLATPPRPTPALRVPQAPPGQLLGRVYRDRDGSVLVLVPPFVVTDSLF